MITTKLLDRCCNKEFTIAEILADWVGVYEDQVIDYFLSFTDHRYWKTSDIEIWADENKMHFNDLAEHLRKVKDCFGDFSYDTPVKITDDLEETMCHLNIGDGIILNFKYMLNVPDADAVYNEDTHCWEYPEDMK
jgi:hypothetical protein